MGLFELIILLFLVAVLLVFIIRHTHVVFHSDKHKHDWSYRGRTISGWGVATCRTCGEKELY